MEIIQMVELPRKGQRPLFLGLSKDRRKFWWDFSKQRWIEFRKKDTRQNPLWRKDGSGKLQKGGAR